jgi:adenylate kinase
LAAGLLVPDEITIPIVEKYLAKDEYKKGWILDGFPRTLDQAEKFKTKIDVAFCLLVPDKEALWRLSFRMGLKGEIREDETLMAIRKRIDLFHKATEPVLDHYRKLDLLVEVNGEKKIEEICSDILGKIRWYQKGNGNKG